MNFKKFEDGLQAEIEISEKFKNHGIKKACSNFSKAPYQKFS